MSAPDLLVVPVDFKPGPDGPVPIDPALYSMVMQWCMQNLAEVPDLKRYFKTIAVVELGEQGELLEVHHVSSLRYAPDIPLFRSVGRFSKRVTQMAHDRWQAWCSDNGWRGQDVLIWVDEDEKPEQQCANRETSVTEFNLRPAKRMLVRVR